ncbi:MAG: ABC transporter ATP-binding protein [Actinomycetota bacterium]|nr:ABC transporter ATP-binding protein [Actinomycetota bacterium]
MAETLLEVDSLEVRYGVVPAVRGASLTVGRGEIVGLVGPNGAGKSTLLLSIMGVVPAARGSIRYAGNSILGHVTERIVRSGIALVPEGRHIFDDLTVEENLRLGLVGRSTSDGVQADREWIYGLFPVVHEFARRQAGLLSGGQRQQLAIARALIAKPQMLLLDEPSLGLSPTVVDTVWNALAEIRAGGMTILLAEQRAQITVSFADRSYVLGAGQVKMELTPAEADDTDRMVEAYFG